MVKHKYKNTKVEYDGRTFDSKKEMYRYHDLKIMERAGEIKDLECQKVYVLIPSVKLSGRNKPPLRYSSDFSYVQTKDGKTIVEDVKGAYTAKLEAYRMRKHLMMFVHGIEITEI